MQHNNYNDQDIPPCTECGKRFSSQKALYGHMRCHPERQWRGINPPKSIRRPIIGKSALHEMMTEEEHEVANYLLMLANGYGMSESHDVATMCSNHHGLHEHAALMLEGGTSSSVFGRFECSSCKKVFGSHQALGGHRATHKNVKGCFAINRSDEFEDINHKMNTGLRIWDVGVGGSNIIEGGHRCDICLKVFSSGQALGGHKRCHWEKGDIETAAAAVVNNPIVTNLDLNLPAQNTSVVDQDQGSSSGLSLDLKLGL